MEQLWFFIPFESDLKGLRYDQPKKKSFTDRHTHKVTYGGGAHLKIYILGLYGYQIWNARVKRFGLGQKGDINLASSEYAPGVIPGMFQNI